MASGSHIGTKDQAWTRICEQIAESALRPEWIHRHLIDQSGIHSADLFREIGGCRLPICISPTAATQLFPCWRAITDLRIEINGWALSSSDPALMEYFETVSRNVCRARVRSTLGKYRGHVGCCAEPRDDEGDINNDFSYDELPPNEPDDLLVAQDSSPALDPTWNVSRNPSTPPKRPAPSFPDVAPDRKSPRVNPTPASKDDQDFANRRAMTTPTYLITVSAEQVQLVGREPYRGWPAYSGLYPGAIRRR